MVFSVSFRFINQILVIHFSDTWSFQLQYMVNSTRTKPWTIYPEPSVIQFKGFTDLCICGGNEKGQGDGELPQSLHLCELTVVIEAVGRVL